MAYCYLWIAGFFTIIKEWPLIQALPIEPATGADTTCREATKVMHGCTSSAYAIVVKESKNRIERIKLKNFLWFFQKYTHLFIIFYK